MTPPVRPINPPSRGDYIKASALSELLDVPLETLAKWRQHNAGPSFIRLDSGQVRYGTADIQAWVEGRKVTTV